MKRAPAVADGAMRLLALLVGCCCVAPAEAAGISIFALGTMIDEYHWDIMFMYYGVFGVTLILEITVHHVHGVVSSNSGKDIVHRVVKQVMILGGISAILVVFTNIGGAKVIDALLFQYVHFVIFMMAILFIALVTSLFVTIGPRWESWARFEAKVVEIESDPSLCDQDRTAFLAAYVKTVKHGNAMLSCLSYFRSNLPFKFYGISFSRYMEKMQRKIMLTFLNLRYVAWCSLALLTSLAAFTTWVTISTSDNRVATIGLWVLIVGFGPLILLVVLAMKVRYEFHQFAIDVQEMRQHRRKMLRSEQSTYFWFGNPMFAVHLMQVMLLYQAFYLSSAIINFSSRLYIYGAEENKEGRGIFLIVLCFLPSVVVFAVVLPRMLPNFTILASVGEYIDHSVLIGILNSDKRTGKNRRVYRRDKNIIDIAPLMRVDHTELLLCQENADKGEPVKDAFGDDESDKAPPPPEQLPLFKRRGETDVQPEVLDTDRVELCVECDTEPASVKCNRCGLLCDKCDVHYHMLRHLRNHTRALFDDNPGRSPLSRGGNMSFYMGRSFDLSRIGMPRSPLADDARKAPFPSSASPAGLPPALSPRGRLVCINDTVAEGRVSSDGSSSAPSSQSPASPVSPSSPNVFPSALKKRKPSLAALVQAEPPHRQASLSGSGTARMQSSPQASPKGSPKGSPSPKGSLHDDASAVSSELGSGRMPLIRRASSSGSGSGCGGLAAGCADVSRVAVGLPGMGPGRTSLSSVSLSAGSPQPSALQRGRGVGLGGGDPYRFLASQSSASSLSSFSAPPDPTAPPLSRDTGTGRGASLGRGGQRAPYASSPRAAYLPFPANGGRGTVGAPPLHGRMQVLR